MCCFSAAHFSEQTQRKATLHRESQTSCSRLGAVLATSSKLMKAKVFFFFKSLGLSVCIFYGKKAAKRFSKLLNIVLKSRSCVWGTGADGRGRLILRRLVSNKSTYGKHLKFSVGVSTVLEHTERAVRSALGERRFFNS